MAFLRPRTTASATTAPMPMLSCWARTTTVLSKRVERRRTTIHVPGDRQSHARQHPRCLPPRTGATTRS
eukprot:4248835-Pyramimonas_sp.AAC.1